MFIRSQNLFMRPCWPEEYFEMVALMNEGAPTPNVVALPRPVTAEDPQRFIDRQSGKLLPNFLISLVKPEGSEMIGGIGLGRDGDEIELGCWIARAYRGRGFAAEAIRAVLTLARTLGHKRVIANHFAGSPASRHVLEWVGFRPKVERRWGIAHVRAGEVLSKPYVIDLAESFGLCDYGGDNSHATLCAA